MSFELPSLTIVVPVLDRHYNLPMQFDNLKDIACRKIVIDSTVEPYVEDVPEDWEYVHIGRTHYFDMRKHASELVTTDFIVDCPDDDHLQPDGLVEAVDFLSGNPDYVACDGVYMVHKNNRHIQWKGQEHSRQVRKSFFSEDPLERAIFHLSKKVYYSRAHSVVRLPVFDAVATLYRNNKYLPVGQNWPVTPNMDEALTMLYAFHGNMMTLPSFYSDKQVGNNRGRAIRNPEIRKQLKMDDNNAKKVVLKDQGISAFAHTVSNALGIEHEDAIRLVRQAWKSKYKLF